MISHPRYCFFRIDWVGHVPVRAEKISHVRKLGVIEREDVSES